VAAHAGFGRRNADAAPSPPVASDTPTGPAIYAAWAVPTERAVDDPHIAYVGRLRLGHFVPPRPLSLCGWAVHSLARSHHSAVPRASPSRSPGSWGRGHHGPGARRGPGPRRSRRGADEGGQVIAAGSRATMPVRAKIRLPVGTRLVLAGVAPGTGLTCAARGAAWLTSWRRCPACARCCWRGTWAGFPAGPLTRWRANRVLGCAVVWPEGPAQLRRLPP
jgi:hypothetical protein